MDMTVRYFRCREGACFLTFSRIAANVRPRDRREAGGPLDLAGH